MPRKKIDAKKAQQRFDSMEMQLPASVLKISFNVDRKSGKVVCLGGRDGECMWEEVPIEVAAKFADGLSKMLRSV